ncbi:MAG: hypothetical protein E2O39_13490 [Planctomycetota bacterium]|nr:MAG: hypothetical protein E2O39_13490 [Planctomycetota bacterium]
MAPRKKLARLLDRLEQRHGVQRPPPAKSAFELVLWENVAYLVSDEQRETAFLALVKQVGRTPAAIRAASREALLDVTVLGGMHPERRVSKLTECADIALEHHGGKLESVLARPTPEARRALKRFPGIGEPGAQKILLFRGAHPYLALESNGLRVLVRLGWGEEAKSYAATYRSAQAAAEPELAATCPARVRAHHLLRKHGQVTCKHSAPHCDECPISTACAYYARED